MLGADYLEQMVRDKALPSITWKEPENHPCITCKNVETRPSITRYEEQIERVNAEIRNLSLKNAVLMERATIMFPQVVEVVALEALRARILFDLKLGKQAPGYKTAQKALNRFIAELTHLTENL